MSAHFDPNFRLIWIHNESGASGIPAGFARDNQYDGRAIQGHASGQINGGGSGHTHDLDNHTHTSDSHVHYVSAGSATASTVVGVRDASPNITFYQAPHVTHSHVSGPSSAASITYSASGSCTTDNGTGCFPQHITAIIIKPLSAISHIPSGVIAFTDTGTIPNDFSVASGINEYPNLSGLFVVGAVSGGDGGQVNEASGHSHNVSKLHKHTENVHHHNYNLCSYSTPTFDTYTGFVSPGYLSSFHHNVRLTATSSGNGDTSSENIVITSGVYEPAYTKLLGVQTTGSTSIPSGLIFGYVGQSGDLNLDEWEICNGDFGTTDLSETQIKITTDISEIGNTDGSSNNHSHFSSHTHDLPSGTHTHSTTVIMARGGVARNNTLPQNNSPKERTSHTHTWTVTSTSGGAIISENVETTSGDCRGPWRTMIWVKSKSVEEFIPYSGNNDLFIHGQNEANNNFALFMFGNEEINDSCDLFVTGYDTCDNSFDLLIHGKHSNDDSCDLFVCGHDESTSSIDLFMYGQDTKIGDCNLFITGNEDLSDDVTLYLAGLNVVNDDIDLFINGYDKTTSYTTLVINGRNNVDESTTLFIHGCDDSTQSCDLFIAGENYSSDNTTLYIAGISEENSNIDLYIGGFYTTISSADLYICGYNASTSFITLFIDGKNSFTESCNLFINGDDSDTLIFPLFIHGHYGLTQSCDLFIHGSHDLSNNTTLYVGGFDNVNSDVNLFIGGYSLKSSYVDLFIDGHDTLIQSGDLFIGGFETNSSSSELFIGGRGLLDDNIELFISGLNTSSDSVDLYINGLSPTFASCDLFISGSTGNTYDDNIPLFIDGIVTRISGVPCSGEFSLIINGYEPTPAPVCPIPDPNASFQIPSRLIDLYKDRIDSMINQAGKNVVLQFDKIVSECPNCYFDNVSQKSSGRYKLGGPSPFNEGQKCPYCKGNGVVGENAELCIKCLITWNPQDIDNYGISVSSTGEIIKLKTLITYADKLKRANVALIDRQVSGITEYRAKLVKGPYPIGLREDRYCISFWRTI